MKTIFFHEQLVQADLESMWDWDAMDQWVDAWMIRQQLYAQMMGWS